MYKKEKSHNELLNLINATVSHEMRNPLNSINAQNIENCALYNELEELIFHLGSKLETKCRKDILHLIERLKEGNKVQESSTNLMKHLI